ncbi:MAG: hypothetical protein QNK37_06850 [Acidobacteriota bacterium]|nr:hypothetical protein [Acidobacteriota bacterium]
MTKSFVCLAFISCLPLLAQPPECRMPGWDLVSNASKISVPEVPEGICEYIILQVAAEIYLAQRVEHDSPSAEMFTAEAKDLNRLALSVDLGQSKLDGRGSLRVMDMVTGTGSMLLAVDLVIGNETAAVQAWWQGNDEEASGGTRLGMVNPEEWPLPEGEKCQIELYWRPSTGTYANGQVDLWVNGIWVASQTGVAMPETGSRAPDRIRYGTIAVDGVVKGSLTFSPEGPTPSNPSF